MQTARLCERATRLAIVRSVGATVSTSMGDPPVCVECDKSRNQKPVPAAGLASCQEVYLKVEQCMTTHKGQVSSCKKEWDEFRQCREKSK